MRRRLAALLCALTLMFGGAVAMAPAAAAAPILYGCSYPNGYIVTSNWFQIKMHRMFYGYYSCKCIG